MKGLPGLWLKASKKVEKGKKADLVGSRFLSKTAGFSQSLMTSSAAPDLLSLLLLLLLLLLLVPPVVTP